MRRGSVPEIVRHGVSGLIVDDFRSFPQALALAEELDPAGARAEAERRFDLPVMARGYERVYRMLVEGTASIRRLSEAAA
jgi:glycosyltransferase involved in cell wall biosynthesis